MATPKKKTYTLPKITRETINGANFRKELPQILRQIGLLPYASVDINSIIASGNHKTKEFWLDYLEHAKEHNKPINEKNEKNKQINKGIKRYNKLHLHEKTQNLQPIESTINEIYINQGVATSNNPELPAGISTLYAVLRETKDPLSFDNTRFHVTFPEGAWYTKGSDKTRKINKHDIHIFHITDRSKCPDVRKKCPEKSAWFFDVDRQEWVGFCQPPKKDEKEEKNKNGKKDKKPKKKQQSKVKCNVGNAKDYYVDEKYGPPTEGTPKDLWDYLKKVCENPALKSDEFKTKENARQIGYNEYIEYNQHQTVSAEHELVYKTYPNTDIYSMSGINNDIFTTSVLVIAIIIVFCIFNTISCVCGATIGSVTDRAIHKQEEKTLSNQDNQIQDDYDDEVCVIPNECILFLLLNEPNLSICHIHIFRFEL